MSELHPREELRAAAVYLGARAKTKDMEPHIYRVRPDGTFILDAKGFEDRLKIAARFIARFDPPRVIVASAALYGQTPVRKFCEATGCVPVTGRFMPGLLSNPQYPGHIPASLIVVTDPDVDQQGIVEASLVRIPVVALCNTDDTTADVDLVIPVNNKGKRALAITYWLLARQVLRERGELPPDGNLNIPIDDFEAKEA